MFGYLINPENKTVTKVEEVQHKDSIHKLINVEVISGVTITSKGDMVFIDDEGLLKDNQSYFHIVNENGNLSKSLMVSGKGLVLGVDSEGDTANPKVSLEALKNRIYWGNPVECEAERMRILNKGPEVISFDSHEAMMDYLDKRRKEANE